VVSQPQIKRVTDVARLIVAVQPVLQGDYWLIDAVKAGTAQAYEVDDWQTVLIIRYDGTEVVVCCAIGSDLKPALDAMLPKAQAAGFKSVRFHTQRKGLARLLSDYGPTFVEYVYKVEI